MWKYVDVEPIAIDAIYGRTTDEVSSRTNDQKRKPPRLSIRPSVSSPSWEWPTATLTLRMIMAAALQRLSGKDIRTPTDRTSEKLYEKLRAQQH